MEWLKMDELAEYSRLSPSSIKRAFGCGLPSYLVQGRRMVRRSEYDAWATGRLQNRRKNRKPQPRSHVTTKTASWLRIGCENDGPRGPIVTPPDPDKKKNPA